MLKFSRLISACKKPLFGLALVAVFAWLGLCGSAHFHDPSASYLVTHLVPPAAPQERLPASMLGAGTDADPLVDKKMGAKEKKARPGEHRVPFLTHSQFQALDMRNKMLYVTGLRLMISDLAAAQKRRAKVTENEINTESLPRVGGSALVSLLSILENSATAATDDKAPACLAPGGWASNLNAGQPPTCVSTADMMCGSGKVRCNPVYFGEDNDGSASTPICQPNQSNVNDLCSGAARPTNIVALYIGSHRAAYEAENKKIMDFCKTQLGSNGQESSRQDCVIVLARMQQTLNLIVVSDSSTPAEAAAAPVVAAAPAAVPPAVPAPVAIVVSSAPKVNAAAPASPPAASPVVDQAQQARARHAQQLSAPGAGAGAPRRPARQAHAAKKTTPQEDPDAAWMKQEIDGSCEPAFLIEDLNLEGSVAEDTLMTVHEAQKMMCTNERQVSADFLQNRHEAIAHQLASISRAPRDKQDYFRTWLRMLDSNLDSCAAKATENRRAGGGQPIRLTPSVPVRFSGSTVTLPTLGDRGLGLTTSTDWLGRTLKLEHVNICDLKVVGAQAADFQGLSHSPWDDDSESGTSAPSVPSNNDGADKGQQPRKGPHYGKDSR